MEAENGLIFGTGASACKDQEGLTRVIRAAVENGIRKFDTAPSYRTEALLGKALREAAKAENLSREELFVQTKIDLWQMAETGGDVRRHAEGALKRMELEYFDSLLIHWPDPDCLNQTWKSFVQMKRDGFVRRIGICNVRMRQLRSFLEWEQLPEIIQIERNPLRVCREETAFCAEHGMAVQAYSPLCKMDDRIRDSRVLQELSKRHGKSVGQIVLRWHLDTGVTPVFTSTKESRIAEYSSIFDFRLSQEEIASISGLNLDYKMYLESFACPGF